MRIYKQVVAECANAEKKSAKTIERENNNCGNRWRKVSARSEYEERKKQNLQVHEAHEEGRHEQEAAPVSQEEAAEQKDPEPVKEDSYDFLEEVRFENEGRHVAKRPRR